MRGIVFSEGQGCGLSGLSLRLREWLVFQQLVRISIYNQAKNAEIASITIGAIGRLPSL